MILIGVEPYQDPGIDYNIRGKMWTGVIPDHIVGMAFEAVCIMGMWYYFNGLYYFHEGDEVVFFVDHDKLLQASH